MFIFTSLALIKRYVELAARFDTDLPDPSNRNYRKSDLNIVAALAAAAGFNSVTIFALYVSSDTKVEDWCRYYNEERPHGSIGNKPPILLQNHDGAAQPALVIRVVKL
jgi:transposase InsO family protein